MRAWGLLVWAWCLLRLVDRPLAPSSQSSAACRVLHAAFHPLSDNHVVVLSSDHRLRMFNLATIREGDPLVAHEPEVEVALPHTGMAGQPRTFCFGARQGFEQFALFLATTRGTLYVVCPFVPAGCSMPASEWRALRSEVQADLAATESADGGDAGPSETQVREPSCGAAVPSWYHLTHPHALMLDHRA